MIPQDHDTPRPRGGGRPEPVEPPVLPVQTGDDTDAGWGERWPDEQDGADDERFLRERPPHWQ
jgi:hypothetical protein